jgi:hypothetical protein
VAVDVFGVGLVAGAQILADRKNRRGRHDKRLGWFDYAAWRWRQTSAIP